MVAKASPTSLVPVSPVTADSDDHHHFDDDDEEEEEGDGDDDEQDNDSHVTANIYDDAKDNDCDWKLMMRRWQVPEVFT